MTSVLYLGTQPTVPAALAAVGGHVLHLPLRPLPEQAEVALAASPGRPDLVVVDTDQQWDAALNLAADLDRLAITVALVGTLPPEYGIRAMQAGVRDVLPVDAEPGRWADLLTRTARVAASQPAGTNPTQQGKVITVASPKGGVGKTTVATNLAVGLAQRFPGQVVLVDLDVHFGDVASGLNLTPTYTLPDVTGGPALHDALALKSYLTEHETGLYVVPGSDSPAAADSVTAAQVGQLIELLSAQFPYVVIDTAPGLSEHVLAALDRTDRIVLVSSLDVPGVRGLRKEVETLDELGMVVGSRTVVLNFFDTSRGLTVADVEATVRAKVDVVVPLSSAVPISVNQGIPLLQGGSRDRAAARLAELVDLVSETGPARRGLFARRAAHR